MQITPHDNGCKTFVTDSVKLFCLALIGLFFSTSCRVDPGSNQPNSPATVKVFQPFHNSTSIGSTDLVGYRLIIEVETYDDNNNVIHYSGSPHVSQTPSQDLSIRNYPETKSVNQPQGATLLRVDVRVQNTACSWPIPSSTIGAVRGGTAEFEFKSAIEKYPHSFVIAQSQFSKIWESNC